MSDENINVCINVVTKGSIKKTEADLKKLGDTGADAGKKIDQSAKRASTSLETIERSSGFALAGLAALTATAVKSISAFRAFESGLINVQKVTNISGKNLASFGKEIDRLARRIPVGTSELLNISQTAGQLGIEGAKNILAFTEAVALLTRTTDLTIDSAQSIAQLIEVTRTAPEDVGRLAAVLVDLGNNFSATESQILDVSTRIAQSTTEFNLFAEDAVKLGAVIAGVGEKAEASGTAIGKTFRALQNAIELAGPPLERLTSLTGLQRDELRRLFESDPTELLRKFTQGIKQANKEGELISTILDEFGLKTDRVRRVLGPLIKNTDRVNDAFRRTEEQIRLQNAAVEEASKQFRSLESAEIQTANATNELAKAIGTALEPAYRSILEGIRTTSLQITRFVEDNSTAFKVIAGAVAGATVAFAGLAAVALIPLLGIGKLALGVVAGLTAIGAVVTGVAVKWDSVTSALETVNLTFLKLKETALDYLTTTSFLQNKQTEDQKKQLEAVREEIKAIEEKRSEREKQKKLDEEEQQANQRKIDQIRELEDRQEELRKVALGTNKERAIAAQQEIKSIDERIQAINELSVAELQATQSTEDRLKSLLNQRLLLNEQAKNAGIIDRQVAEARIAIIDEEIAKINERKKAEDDSRKEGERLKRLDEIAKAEQDLQNRLIDIRKVANDKSTDGIQEAVTKETELKLQGLRKQAIDLGDFRAARAAEIKLDRLEEQRKERENQEKITEERIKAEQDRIQKIEDIRQEQRDLETERKELEIEVQFTDNEREIELVQQRIDQIEILKLEARQRELEAEGQHFEALRVQRQIDDKKRAQEFKVRSDREIRDERARAQVKRVLAQTTSEQIIGIGDNLIQAGIIQGKTAGKALKTLKTGEAIVNTYAGANLALSSSPPPFNFIAAASVIASGLANIVQIQSQKFNTGGIVQPVSGAQSRGIDQVPALLSVGEEVLTRNSPRHRDNISREQDEALLNAINGLREDIRGMQTVVNIDGKEVADVIQEQRFRGVN